MNIIPNSIAFECISTDRQSNHFQTIETFEKQFSSPLTPVFIFPALGDGSSSVIKSLVLLFFSIFVFFSRHASVNASDQAKIVSLLLYRVLGDYLVGKCLV